MDMNNINDDIPECCPHSSKQELPTFTNCRHLPLDAPQHSVLTISLNSSSPLMLF